MGIISEETLEHANKTLRHLGYSVSFGKYVHELNDDGSPRGLFIRGTSTIENGVLDTL